MLVYLLLMKFFDWSTKDTPWKKKHQSQYLNICAGARQTYKMSQSAQRRLRYACTSMQCDLSVCLALTRWPRTKSFMQKVKHLINLSGCEGLTESLLYYNIWAAAWENQPKDLCAQRKHRSAWASTQSDQSSLSAWRSLGSLASHRADSEDWSDWADAQADLRLRWAYRSFCWFCHEAAQSFCKFCCALYL